MNSDYCQRKNKVERRKLYSELVRLRNNRRLSTENVHNVFLRYSSNYVHYNDISDDYVHTTNFVQNRNVTHNPIYRNTVYDANIYENFTHKNQNEHGLINKKLFENSSVTKSQIKEFCVVCQDNINIDDIIRTLSCFHRFHIQCVDEWFIEQHICPLCKCNLF